MHAMSLNAFASQAAINAMMIMGRFTVARIYKFLFSEPGACLCSKSRYSLSALGKFIGLLEPTCDYSKTNLTVLCVSYYFFLAIPATKIVEFCAFVYLKNERNVAS